MRFSRRGVGQAAADARTHGRGSWRPRFPRGGGFSFNEGDRVDDDAVRAFVRDRGERRDVTKGERAMAHAMLYPELDKRGRGNKAKGAETADFSRRRLQEARSVLRHSPKLAASVRDGDISLVISPIVGIIQNEAAAPFSRDRGCSRLGQGICAIAKPPTVFLHPTCWLRAALTVRCWGPGPGPRCRSHGTDSNSRAAQARRIFCRRSAVIALAPSGVAATADTDFDRGSFGFATW